MEIERRLHEHIEIRSEGDKFTLRGYAAVFNSATDLGRITEEIRTGAFDSVLEGQDVVFTYNHSLDTILARSTSGTLRYGVDKTGLWYEADVADTTAGRDLKVLVERGDITANSFAFSHVLDEVEKRNGKMHRIIKKVGVLHDISVVRKPAYKDSIIVRSGSFDINDPIYKKRIELLKRIKY